MHKHRQSSGIFCQYCELPAELTDGDVIYPGLPHLRHKPYWLCKRCDAWVGCKPNTTTPTAPLANAVERERRKNWYANQNSGKRPPPKPHKPANCQK